MNTTTQQTTQPTTVRTNTYGNQYGSKTAPSGNKPVAKFKAGAITATIWANPAKMQSESGQPTPSWQTGEAVYHSISLDRRYMDKSGAWQSTSSMRVNDLPKAALVLQKAYEHLVLQDTGEGAQAHVAFANPAAIMNLSEEEVLVV